MENARNSFTIEELEVLNSYWSEVDQDILIKKLQVNLSLIKGHNDWLAQLLSSIIERLKKMDQGEFKRLMNELPYDEFEKDLEEIEERKKEVKKEMFMEKWAITDYEDGITEDDLELPLTSENSVEFDEEM